MSKITEYVKNFAIPKLSERLKDDPPNNDNYKWYLDTIKQLLEYTENLEKENNIIINKISKFYNLRYLYCDYDDGVLICENWFKDVWLNNELYADVSIEEKNKWIDKAEKEIAELEAIEKEFKDMGDYYEYEE